MNTSVNRSKDFVLDCSVTMAWCFEDETSDYSENIFDALRNKKAFVPPIWTLEVANVLLCSERRGRLNYAKAIGFIESIRELPIIHDDNTQIAIATTLELARETNLSIYDASYLELALRLHIPLATLDKDLQKAAEKSGVKLY